MNLLPMKDISVLSANTAAFFRAAAGNGRNSRKRSADSSLSRPSDVDSLMTSSRLKDALDDDEQMFAVEENVNNTALRCLANVAAAAAPASQCDEKERKEVVSNPCYLSQYPQPIAVQPDPATAYYRGITFRLGSVFRNTTDAIVTNIAYLCISYLEPEKMRDPRSLLQTFAAYASKGASEAQREIVTAALSTKYPQEKAMLLAADVRQYIESETKEFEGQFAFSGLDNFYVSPYQFNETHSLIVRKEGSVFLLLDDKIIGKGATKVATLALECFTGEWFACSTIPDLAKAQSELNAMTRVQDVKGCIKKICSVSCFSHVNDGGPMTKIITPLYTFGTLTTLLNLGIPEDDRPLIMIELLKTLDGAIQQGILIGDLKPDNIFLREGEIIIGDIGGCVKLHPREGKFSWTPLYCAPEFVRELKRKSTVIPPDAEKLIVWSLGCILYAVFGNTLPWKNAPLIQVYEQVSNLSENWLDEPTKDTYHHLIWQMLRINPEKRPSFNILLQKALDIQAHISLTKKRRTTPLPSIAE